MVLHVYQSVCFEQTACWISDEREDQVHPRTGGDWCLMQASVLAKKLPLNTVIRRLRTAAKQTFIMIKQHLLTICCDRSARAIIHNL